jgi:type 1 glutamine amidotransferase
LTGTVEGHEAEPIAWTNIRTDGGRTFYTSLGHIDDFKQPAFRRLLSNAVYWAAGLDIPSQTPTDKVSKK